MWTGKYENLEYTAQITPYHGKIYAEIIKKNAETGGKSGDIWLSIMDKSFGKAFRKTPREKDWINAHGWVKKQFDLITTYGTALVTTPKYLRDIEKQNNL